MRSDAEQLNIKTWRRNAILGRVGLYMLHAYLRYLIGKISFLRKDFHPKFFPYLISLKELLGG